MTAPAAATAAAVVTGMSPVMRAEMALGARLRPSRRYGWMLDGRPAALPQIVAAANAALAARGEAGISYPGVTPPPPRRTTFARPR